MIKLRQSPNFLSTYHGLGLIVSYVKTLVAAFNQKKAQVLGRIKC